MHSFYLPPICFVDDNFTCEIVTALQQRKLNSRSDTPLVLQESHAEEAENSRREAATLAAEAEKLRGELERAQVRKTQIFQIPHE